MQGVFNLYGAQFARSVASALPGLVAKNLALNLLKLTGATIATIGINEMFFR